MLKYMGAWGITAGASTLVSGLAGAAGLDRLDEITKSEAVKSGKVKQLTFLQTTDIHGQLLTHPELFVENGQIKWRNTGGMSRIATVFNQVKRENPGRTMAIDTGDCFEHSGTVTLSKGEAMVPIMNKVGYDLALPGNWEVEYGPQRMVYLMNKYNFPVVCSNMYWGEDGAVDGPDIFPPFYVKEMAGVRIGFIGHNDPFTKIRQHPSYHEGIQFREPVDATPKLVEILKTEYKCDLVIMLAHLGLAQQVHLAKQPQTAGVDFLLGGDTHERTYEPIVGGNMPVVEPGSFGSFVGRLDVFVEDGKLKDYNYKLLVVDENEYPEDHEVKKVVERERAPYASIIDRKLGESKDYLYRYSVLETPMDNMITDAIADAASVDIGISNGYRYGAPIPPGPITVDHLYCILPPATNLKRGIATGKQIWDWLEIELENVFATDATKRNGGWLIRFSGMELVVTLGNTKGSRVQSIKVRGQDIQLDKEYTVAGSEREGEPMHVIWRLKNLKNVERMAITNYDAIEMFLQKHPVVDYKIEGRVVATDAQGLVFSDVPGTNYRFR